MKRFRVLLTPVVVFAALELFLAGVNLVVPWDGAMVLLSLRSGKFVYNREFAKLNQYLRDPDLLWRLRPGRFPHGFYINSRGFRGDEVDVAKPEGTIRIICTGNSCTFGAFVDSLGDTYAARLSVTLNREHPQQNYEVINAGVNGYTVFQILKYWRRDLAAYQPDIVTVYSGFNDIVYASTRSDKDLKTTSLTCTISNQLLNFRVFRTLDAVAKFIRAPASKGELMTPYDSAYGLQRRVSPEDYRENLSLLAEDAGKRKVRIVFITAPFVHEYPLCLVPRPRITDRGNRQMVSWRPPDEVNAEWSSRVDSLRAYQAELDAALQKIRLRPEMPALHYQAAYCYLHLGDSLRAAQYFALSDSLDDDHHCLRAYNQIMREVAAQYQLPLVDCEKIFEARNSIELFTMDGIHPNEKGHKLIAESLAAEIDNIALAP